VVCSQQNRILVDCCIKKGLKPPDIYWEVWERSGCPGGFLPYGSIEVCAVESIINSTSLSLYMSWHGGIFYSLPSVGGCLPYAWSSSGYGHFVLQDEFGIKAKFELKQGEGESLTCKSATDLIVMDRCGGIDKIHVEPCCEQAEPPVLLYSSLYMYCGTEQDFVVEHGCGPFDWSLQGGGILVPKGTSAHYTAPGTNPNCSSNPTITVTDCCGNMASISLAINCYTAPDTALIWAYLDIFDAWQTPDGFLSCCLDYTVTEWRCDGILLSFCETNPAHDESFCKSTSIPRDIAECEYFREAGCSTNQCPCPPGGCACNALTDGRSAAMKLAGCCPLNPFTGLPY
jgi:hypothetical protein